uniref:Receptor expression-enhancing protein n=1 Tax=Glossina palpalis gambiensis TaxID=67801 RepID=A0A1B0C7S0_9MUSC
MTLPCLPQIGFSICVLMMLFFSSRIITKQLIFHVFRLSFGTLYPAYASYKAVRTKNVKEYVKWMMYWIVYAFFTCCETFTDIFLSWFPFYYEVKVVIVLWLLSPATKGSSTLYRKFVHPMLTRREQEIDEYISQAKERGYSAVLQLGSKGVNYATNVIMQTAIKRSSSGCGYEYVTRAVESFRDQIMGTFEYGLRAGNHQHQTRMVTLSRPDDAIYSNHENVRCNEIDAIGQQSYSVTRLSLLESIQKDFSEDDDFQFNGELFEYKPAADEEISGAARIRELPFRKTKFRNAQSKVKYIGTKKTETGDKRRRRKLLKQPLDEDGGGNLVQTIRRSYSLSDLSEPDLHRKQEEVDEVVSLPSQQRTLRSRFVAPANRHSTGMYFTEVDVTSRAPADFNYNIRSSDDISSGYSSTEPVSANLSRTSSMTNASRPRPRTSKRSEGIVVYKFQQFVRPLQIYSYFQDIPINQSPLTLNKQAVNNFGYTPRKQNFEVHPNPLSYTSSFPGEMIYFLNADVSSSDESYESASDKEFGDDQQNDKNFFNWNIKAMNSIIIGNSEQILSAEQVKRTAEKRTARPYLHNKGKAPEPLILTSGGNKIKSSLNDMWAISSKCASFNRDKIISASYTTLPRSKKAEKVIGAGSAKYRIRHEK